MEKYNVLVVNQDFKSLHTIFDYLEEESIYNVMNATNSKMVQTIIRKKELDVVLLDWETSIASELEVYHYLQQQSSTKEVPIVISTHPARTQTINEIITTDISGYVPKPIEKPVLIKIINQAIEGHKESKAKRVAEKNALEQAKQQMLEEQNRIAREKQKVESNRYAVLEEQKRLKNELEEERSRLANDKAQLENEKKRLDLNQSDIASTKDQIEASQIDLQQKEEQLHLAKTTLLEEREAFFKEKQGLAEEREKLLREQQETVEEQQYQQSETEKQRQVLEASQQHLEDEKQKLESEQQQIEKEKLRLQQQNEALEKEKARIAQDKKEISSARKSLRKQEALLAKSKTQELSESEKVEAKDTAEAMTSAESAQSLEKLNPTEVNQKKVNQPTNPKIALETPTKAIEEESSASEPTHSSEKIQEQQPLTKPEPTLEEKVVTGEEENVYLSEKTREQAPATPETWVMEREQLDEMRKQLFKAKENFEEEKERFIQEKERILLENNKAREGSKELNQLQKSVLSAKDQLSKIERELTQKQAKLKLIEMEEKASSRSTSAIPQQLQRATEETLTTSDMTLEGHSFSKLLEEEASRLHTSSLMQYILPEEIAKDLVKADYEHVNYYPSVSILYIGFADLMSTVLKTDRSQLIDELEVFFKTINDRVQEYGLERVRTKNNMYACAQRQLSAEDPMPLLKASFEIRQMALNYHSQSKQVNDLVKKMYLGVNTTDVVAGDTIHKRFAYDIWSDIIQTTYHLKKSTDVPIHLLENTYKIVGDQINCEHVGKIRTNRRGDWKVYELISLG